MKNKDKVEINLFQKYLSVWVAICMVVGIAIGKFLPGVPEFLNQFEYANVSIPIAILIWVMIYPMMMKVDFQSVKKVGKNPKGLYVTWVVNWLIKPFTMYAIASFFLFVVFKNFIALDLAKQYLAGAVPEVNGEVIFSLNEDIPGMKAGDIYNRLYSAISAITADANQKNSRIALVNKEKHVIAAKCIEWLVFSNSFPAFE